MTKLIQVASFYYQPVVLGRPREDFSVYDAKSGAFVVADGVGLCDGIEYYKRYPGAGSGRLSQAFCGAFIDYFSGHHRGGLREGFRAGNEAAGKINRGRSKYTVLKEHRGLLAATAAMVRLQDRILEWGHICDAGVAIFGSAGEIKLKRDDCRHHFELPRDARRYDIRSRSFFTRTLLRNALGSRGKRLGYGVVTGEPEAEAYLETGLCHLRAGDVVLLYSDGFAPYLGLPNFLKLLLEWDKVQELGEAVEAVITEKTAFIGEVLKKEKITSYQSLEMVEARFKEVLAHHYWELEWGREKSLIVIKV